MSGEETYDEFARPGDAGFTGFPKQPVEDTISYAVYLVPPSEVDLTVLQRRSKLTEVLRASDRLRKSLFSDYIWQRENYKLRFDDSGGSHLQGETDYGDSIADEWVIVYLLRELSKQCEDVWIRVSDADGQFLLVEAANVLPRWLNPEVADYRVWIHKGQLRVIPRSLATPGNSNAKIETITLDSALSLIKSNSTALIHSPQIEAEAFYRLRKYPAAIAETMHTAKVILPRKLAHVLRATPSSISPAVEAFHLRDPIAMRPLQAKSGSSLSFLPGDMVIMSVKFAKVGFAQLKSQEFVPPKSWQDIMQSNTSAGEAERARMGMKVTCGFEMLIADRQNQDKQSVREIRLLLDDLDSGEETLPLDREVAEWPDTEDDEKWLDVNFEAFEQELSGRAGAGDDTVGREDIRSGAFGDANAQDNLRRIVQQFEHFLNDEQAGPEGAEDDMDYDDDDEDDEDSDPNGSDDAGEDKDASFTEDDLALMMKQMMGMPPSMTEGRVHEVAHDGALDKQEKPIRSSKNQRDTSEAHQVSTTVGPKPDGRSPFDHGDDGEDDTAAIQELVAGMEAELKAAGALDLSDSSNHIRKKLAHGEGASAADVSEDDARYLLAANMLESFKSQAGQAGPAGNLMASMGVRMPRNEDDE